jgi:ComF family protein
MLTMLANWGRAALDLVYPANCAVCGQARPSGGRSMLCAACLDGLRPLPRPFCARCSLPFDGATTAEFTCTNCANEDYAFERAVCGCRLTGVARECVHRFKYGRAEWLGPELAGLMIAAARERIAWARVDVVVPVPLFAGRERERGFNQSAWLARRLVKALPVPLSLRNLWRVRDTSNQARLNKQERRENVEGAFKARRPAEFTGRGVVLVDDVFTTGATTNECAKVLRDAGAVSVMVLAAARG